MFVKFQTPTTFANLGYFGQILPSINGKIKTHPWHTCFHSTKEEEKRSVSMQEFKTQKKMQELN